MFRLQSNTPPVYVEESRDFQLFCRLYDCVNNSVRFDINSIPNLLNAEKINDRLLGLLSTKQGFFTKRNLNSNVLRQILSAFPYIMKYKGTEKGIELAVNTILKIEGINEVPTIVYLKDNNDNLLHSIRIYTQQEIKNTVALDELLKYVLPIGYTYELSEYIEYTNTSIISTFDTVNTLINPAISNSQIIGSDRFAYNTFDIKIDLTYTNHLGQSVTESKTTYFNAYNISEQEFTRNTFYINLNELFNIDNLINSKFKITLNNSAANISWGVDQSASFSSGTSSAKTISSSNCTLTVQVTKFNKGDQSDFGLRYRMEQLFIGNTAMTQVIGSAQYLSTEEYSICNNPEIERDTIDISGNSEINTYGDSNE